jgi:hypothetical protein
MDITEREMINIKDRMVELWGEDNFNGCMKVFRMESTDFQKLSKTTRDYFAEDMQELCNEVWAMREANQLDYADVIADMKSFGANTQMVKFFNECQIWKTWMSNTKEAKIMIVDNWKAKYNDATKASSFKPKVDLGSYGINRKVSDLE